MGRPARQIGGGVVSADLTLLDRDAVAEQVYRIRNGDDKWRAAIKTCGRIGSTLPWLITEEGAPRWKEERRRMKAEPPVEAAE